VTRLRPQGQAIELSLQLGINGVTVPIQRTHLIFRRDAGGERTRPRHKQAHFVRFGLLPSRLQSPFALLLQPKVGFPCGLVFLACLVASG
jgi:hypothetical protein